MAVGIVPTEGRGDLPYLLLGGIALEAWATTALEQGGATPIARGMPWSAVQELGVPVVLHDPLCPLTPATLLGEAIAAAASLDVVVGCRPVTDTIKTVTDGKVGGTVDRERLLAVASPIVLPPHVVAALTQWPDAADFAELVTALRERFPVRFVEVPPLGRRVDDRSALHVLAAAAEMHQD